ncbi:PLP-dependent aminotransferase family protein [candidate division KSB1 bacterium]
MKNFEDKLSRLAGDYKGSEIRRLFSISMQPGMISLAGGLPDPKSFPATEMAGIIGRLLEEKGEVLLQYGPSLGTEEGIAAALDRMSRRGIEAGPDEVIIVSGSIQAAYLMTRVILDPDDTVLVENPTFIGALGAFRNAGIELLGVPMDDQGIIPEKLEAVIKEALDMGHRVKLLYTIPNFQNPTGVTLSAIRRRRVLDIAAEYDILIFEDDPYGELWFRGGPERVKPLKALEGGERVLYAGSFSKIVSPGIRLGWLAAPAGIIKKCEITKQSLDICSSPLFQAVAAEMIREGFIDGHVERLRGLYRSRCEAMLEALDEHMPAGVTWTRPDGGFFVWVTLPVDFDARAMLEAALDNRVAYVIGSAFYADGSGGNTLRLSFSQESEKDIAEGVRRLAEAMKGFIDGGG